MKRKTDLPLFVLLMMFLAFFFFGCGGGGGGGDSSSTNPVVQYAGEYRGTYINTSNATDTGRWSLSFNQTNSSVTGIATEIDTGETHSFTGSVKGDVFSVQQGNAVITLVIDGDNVSGTFTNSRGTKYNITGSIYSGIPLAPSTSPSAVIGGTPIADDPPLPSDDVNAPVISNLTLSPTSVAPGDSLTIRLTFNDRDADVTTFGIKFLNETKYYAYDISGAVSGFAAFNLNVTDVIGDIAAGSYTLSVFVVDASGNASNYLNTTITVTGVGGLDSIVTQDYWVLNAGNVYYYDNGILRMTTEKLLPYITENVTRMHLSYATSDESLYLKYDSNGFLVLHGTISSSGNIKVPSSATIKLPNIFEVDKYYNISFQFKKYNSNGAYLGLNSSNNSFLLTGPEVTTVPAGTYTAYKLTVTEYWTDWLGQSGTDTQCFWLAKNIGIVKWEDEGRIYNLVSMTTP